MTDKQINHGNELLHRFMNGDPDPKMFTPKGWQPIIRDYLTDWNYIMRVVKKIESAGYAFLVDSNAGIEIYTTAHQPIVTVDNKGDKGIKMEDIFKACVKFTKWYKKQLA